MQAIRATAFMSDSDDDDTMLEQRQRRPRHRSRRALLDNARQMARYFAFMFDSDDDDTPLYRRRPRRRSRRALLDDARRMARYVISYYYEDEATHGNDECARALIRAVDYACQRYNYEVFCVVVANVSQNYLRLASKSECRKATREALRFAMAAVDRCVAPAGGWERVTIAYACAVRLSNSLTSIFEDEKLDYSSSQFADQVGDYVARYCRVANCYDFDELIDFVRPFASPTNCCLLPGSDFWTTETRRYAYGASVQIYSSTCESMSFRDRAKHLFQLFSLVLRGGRHRRYDSVVSPLRVLLEVGDSGAIVQLRYCRSIVCDDRAHSVCNPDAVNCDAKHFILVDDDQLPPSAPYDSYALRFDVGAFRRELTDYLPSVLTYANECVVAAAATTIIDDGLPFFPTTTPPTTTSNIRQSICDSRLNDNDDDDGNFLRWLVDVLSTRLSDDEYDIVRSILERMLGADQFHDAVHSCSCADNKSCDDVDYSTFPLRSSPFRLLRDCVSYIGWTSDLSSDEYVRALKTLATTFVSQSYDLRYNFYACNANYTLPYHALRVTDAYTRLSDKLSLQRLALLAVVKNDATNSRLSRLADNVRRRFVDDVKPTPTRCCCASLSSYGGGGGKCECTTCVYFRHVGNATVNVI